MRLTSFTDYTLRVLIYLAVDQQRCATIEGIADAFGISKNHLMKVVHHLVLSGLVESVRGRGGGIHLAVPAEQIRVGKVVRAAEGEQPIVECFSDRNACRITPDCKLAGVLARAFRGFYAKLDETTLADLVRAPEALARRLQLPA